MDTQKLIRKQPRDFIWLDEFQLADDDWPENYPGGRIWINLHEYKATLAGDASYLKLLLSGGQSCNLVWKSTPDAAHDLQRILQRLTQPLSFINLQKQGFKFYDSDDH
jgi:hypothetical protein